jgi:hypothetical protein
MRHQRQAMGAGSGGDHQIVGADEPPLTLEPGADLTVVLGAAVANGRETKG